MPLDPGLAALDLGRPGLEDEEAPRGRGLAVVDVEVRRDAELVGQGLHAAAGEPLVQHRGQHAAVHEAGVPAEVLPDEGDADELGARVVGPGVRGDWHLPVPDERPRREAARAVLGWHLHVRPRLRQVPAPP